MDGDGGEEDELSCLLCVACPRAVRAVPCGHCVACECCSVRHVLSQLKHGELRPRCSHGCGAEIQEILVVQIGSTPPLVPVYEATSLGRPGALSLRTFLQRLAAEEKQTHAREGAKIAAAEALALLDAAAGARLQLRFFDAVETGDLTECRNLHAEGASIHACDDQHLSPIHICAQLGHVEVAMWLKSEGAAIDAGANGQVALHFACVHGELPFAKWLVSEGADVNARADNGAMPLHGACQEGHIEVIEWLLEAHQGAILDAADEDGAQPLHAACQEGHLAVVELLCARGANVRATDDDGRGPLHACCVNGHLDVAQRLVELGANADACDRLGKRPADFAAANGHTEVVEWLEGRAKD